MSVLSIATALVLDFTLGDPHFAWHPTRLLGRLVTLVEQSCRTLPVGARTQGFVFLAICMALFLLPVALIHLAASHLGPIGAVANGVVIYFALGGTCLARDVGAVSDALSRGELDEARDKLRLLVSRDVKDMGETEIASSAIETLSENFGDSTVATLLYGALGGPTLAWIHRISNTLDAMAGYRTEAYIDFGYASAKLDDILNFIPSRIAAVMVAMASTAAGGRPAATARVVMDHGNALESPNSGYPIAAFAGALGVRLCGPVSYFGHMKDKPFIGEGPRPRASDLSRAMPLYWASYAVAAGLATLLALC